MATVCVRVQDSVKCLVPWTIFQTDDGITLSELFERIKAGRVVYIVPSQDFTTLLGMIPFLTTVLQKKLMKYQKIFTHCAAIAHLGHTYTKGKRQNKLIFSQLCTVVFIKYFYNKNNEY